MDKLGKRKINTGESNRSPGPNCNEPYFNKDNFGHIVVQTLKELYNVPCKLRQKGMTATVVEENYTEFVLMPPAGVSVCDNTAWQIQESSGQGLWKHVSVTPDVEEGAILENYLEPVVGTAVRAREDYVIEHDRDYITREYYLNNFPEQADGNLLIFDTQEEYEEYLSLSEARTGQLVVNPNDGLYYTIVYDGELDEFKYELFKTTSVIEKDIQSDLTVGSLEAGQIMPKGLTLTEAFTLLLTKTFAPTYVNPTFNMTNNAGSREVGETFNITVTGNFNRGQIKGAYVGDAWDFNAVQNPRAGVATSYEFGGVSSANNSRTYSVTAAATATTINGSVDYSQGPNALNSDNEIVGFLPTGTIMSSTSFIGHNRRYAGFMNSMPTTGSQIRSALLSSSVLNTSSSFSFNADPNEVATIYVVAVPSNKTILNIMTSQNVDVFPSFVLSSIVDIPNAAGVATPYKVYIMQTDSNWSSNIIFNVTLQQ